MKNIFIDVLNFLENDITISKDVQLDTILQIMVSIITFLPLLIGFIIKFKDVILNYFDDLSYNKRLKRSLKKKELLKENEILEKMTISEIENYIEYNRSFKVIKNNEQDLSLKEKELLSMRKRITYRNISYFTDFFKIRNKSLKRISNFGESLESKSRESITFRSEIFSFLGFTIKMLSMFFNIPFTLLKFISQHIFHLVIYAIGIIPIMILIFNIVNIIVFTFKKFYLSPIPFLIKIIFTFILLMTLSIPYNE